MKNCFAPFIILFFLTIHSLYAQDLPQNIDNKGIYEFLDELSNCKIVALNSVIKPYSRKYISERLTEADKKREELNERQKKELDFYLLDFGKESDEFETVDYFGKNIFSRKKVPFKKRIDLFYYKDSLFNFSVNPVMGMEFFNNANGTNYHRWNGLEAYGYAGEHWGFFTSLRDNYESELFALPEYLTQQTGGTFKVNEDGGGDYEKVTGGISYSWKWGSVGIMKDNFEWGNNYHGANIISNRSISFPFFKMHMNPVKWFDFNYIHGWLPSLVVDSNRTYNYGTGNRLIYYDKYIAANMFTFTPFKNLNYSVGNSVIYSDNGIQPGFIIPVIFFKSVDHSTNGMNNWAGQNAQMFFDISSRQIKHLHLYTTLFVDEISFSRMMDKEKHTNFISIKCGFALSDLIKNVTITAEYTRSNPLVYRHFIPTTTFESNNYTLGSYLSDNSEDSYIAINYRPLRGLNVSASYSIAQKGPEYPYNGQYTHNVLGLNWLNYITWSSKTIGFNISYQAFNDIYVFCRFANSDVQDILEKYSPAYFRGKTNTISLGLNWGY